MIKGLSKYDVLKILGKRVSYKVCNALAEVERGGSPVSGWAMAYVVCTNCGYRGYDAFPGDLEIKGLCCSNCDNKTLQEDRSKDGSN